MKTVAVAVLGGVLTIAGIALLVLPGPGFVLVAAGLAVLSTQFTWARKPLDYAKTKAGQGVDEVARSSSRAGLALVAALALLLTGVVEIAGFDLPLLNALTAAFLVLSGVFLFGTVIYARRKGTSVRTPARHRTP